jgi:aspartyl-tRNA synthetase
VPRPLSFIPSCTASTSTTVEALHELDSSPAKLSPLKWVNRTVNCGDLGVSDVGKRVRLCGWVALHRIHGGLTFLNLRDSSGIVQVQRASLFIKYVIHYFLSFHVKLFSCSQITTLPEEFPEAYSVANKLRVEYVVAVEGVVRSRPAESLNAKMKTGAIEVLFFHI